MFQEKGLRQASCMVNEQAVSLALLSCSDLKNNLPFVRFQGLLNSEAQNSLVQLACQGTSKCFHPAGTFLSILLSLPKAKSQDPSPCNFQDCSFILPAPALNEMSHGAIQPL